MTVLKHAPDPAHRLSAGIAALTRQFPVPVHSDSLFRVRFSLFFAVKFPVPQEEGNATQHPDFTQERRGKSDHIRRKK
jgi:hypothetical protein